MQEQNHTPGRWILNPRGTDTGCALLVHGAFLDKDVLDAALVKVASS